MSEFFGPMFGMSLFNNLGNWMINERNMGNQMMTNMMNIGFARENRDIMIGLQREAWDREDNAITRRVGDLRNAGLNPVLAAGQGAQASGPISTQASHAEAPQSRMVMDMQADMIERALRMRDDFATNEFNRNLMAAAADEHNARAEWYRSETFRYEPGQLEWMNIMSQVQERGAQSVLLEEQQVTERLERTRLNSQIVQLGLEIARREIDLIIQNETLQDQIDSIKADLLAQLLANEILSRQEAIRGPEGTIQGSDWRENLYRLAESKRQEYIQKAKDMARGLYNIGRGIFNPEVPDDGDFNWDRSELPEPTSGPPRQRGPGAHNMGVYR